MRGEVRTVFHGKVRLVVFGHGLLAVEHDAGLGGFFAYVGDNPLIDTDAGVRDHAAEQLGAGRESRTRSTSYHGKPGQAGQALRG